LYFFTAPNSAKFAVSQKSLRWLTGERPKGPDEVGLIEIAGVVSDGGERAERNEIRAAGSRERA
jgi:hypothetical protein